MTEDDIVGALGAVTATLAGGGEPRPGQVQMAQAVARAIESGRHLVVQAGTGTGKSLAYAVPAVVSGKKVVVATATKALQDQLAEKDLPSVHESGRPFTFAVLKGRSNYLCRQRAAEIAGGGVSQQLLAEDEEGIEDRVGGAPTTGEGMVDHVRRLLHWEAETTTGDRGELSFEPHPRAWAMVSVGPRECPGAFRCPSGQRCFAEQARAAAAAADVVVVNTHLYGAHLASGGAVLPEHDVVVFDEAHEVEEVMTASLGAEITPGRFRALAIVARVASGEEAASATAEVGELAGALEAQLRGRVGTRVLEPAVSVAYDDEGEPANRELRRPPPHLPSEADVELGRLLELASARVERLTGALVAAEGDDLSADARGRLARAQSAAGHLADDLARFAAPGTDDVAWVDGNERIPVLRLSPVDVGPPLAAALWGEVTAVLTSATIPPRLPERLGLDGFDPDQLDVGSPFDYRTHALLYVARHLPDRRQPESEAALVEELATLIAAAGGRTLALFTSRRATEAAAGALRDRLPYTLLEQGQLPKGRLLAEFAADESSCLFATLGFWQGVDIPGRALSLVTVDRLPFPRPDDPLVAARRDRAGAAAFRLVDLPRAATLLAQGAGRLIRAAGDYGVVAVLDPRLATAGYRGVLLAALPPMRRTTDRRQVEDFLRQALAPATGTGDKVSPPTPRS